MPEFSFGRMVKDPFSIFNIIIIFIVTIVLTAVIGLPILNYLVLKPSGESFFSDFNTLMNLLLSPKSILIMLVLQNSILVSLIYIRVIRFGGHKFKDLGVGSEQLGKSILIGLGLGVLVLAAVSALSAAMSYFGLEQAPPFLLPLSRSGLVLVLIGTVIFAPIGEELFFRGYVFTAVKTNYNRLFAYIFSALVFAVLHLSLEALLPIIIMGIILAYVFERYNSIVPCIIIHAMNNFFAVMILYLTQ